MNFSILLSSTVIAAIFSGVISFTISRKQGSLQYITGERKEWRKKIRKIAAKLDGADYKETVQILTEIKVRINALGNHKELDEYTNDSHIWKLINEIEADNISKKFLKLKQKQLIEYLSLLLKMDWERSKNEVKGNIYDVLSWLMFGGMGIYFLISLLFFNNHTEINKFNLLTMFCIYMLVILISYILFIPKIKDSCVKRLKKAALHGSNEKAFWGLFQYNITLLCYFIALMILFIIFICAIFVVIGNGRPNTFCIALLFFMYAFGMGFRYMSQTLNIENECDYVKSINTIREEYRKKEEKFKKAISTQKNIESNPV